ncbi:MAG: DUF5686 family protein [Melioribacteraceae bacterium]|nr:DUF5686 family protein [Melioribacteraceae bacterium]
MKKALLIFFICSITIAQQFSVKGNISDGATGESLSFANIRIGGTTIGTAANLEGNFEIKLKPGNYFVITSFIGYKSDTVRIQLEENKSISVMLEPIPVKLPEVTVLPGENPANEIIRRAIAAKIKREKKINSYIFKAYTKGLVKTTKDITTTDRSVGISIGTKDTGALKITGIIENESIGYFKKPDNYKDEIIARKQSANTPSTINILTGGRLLQNFYTNDIQFFNRPLVGPISDDALEYYYYIIEDTLAMDDKNVFQVFFEPIDKADPGFYGKLFIADGSFDLIKLDVNLNKAANPGGLFSVINIFQQFVPFDNNIVMPIDYRVFVEGNFLGIAKFGFELNTVFYNYEINSQIDDDYFDMVIIKVMPDADKKDSTFWRSTQTIPNTLAEVDAYRRIDSLESIPRNFWDDFSILSSTIRLSDNYSITGPIALYSFNNITGHSLNFGINIFNELDRRLNLDADVSYGFSDKKFQTNLYAGYFLGDYRTTTLSLKAYNKLTDLFGESVKYNKMTSTLTSIFGKYDFRDYYYTKGFEAKITGEIFPVLRGGIGFINRTDNNAYSNSNFSLLNKSKTYRANKLIYETKINAITAEFTLDFRKYMEDGYYRRRISFGEANVILSGKALFSDQSALRSSLNFQMYEINFSGYLPSFKSTLFNFQLKGIYSDGPVPYQMMYSLPGNIESSGKAFSFRTLNIGEEFGDKGVVLMAQYNWNDELFRLLKIPYLKDWQLVLTTHFSAALLQISDKSKSILPHLFTEFKHPFYEIGFGIGQSLFPITLEFTWRLNYRGKNDFVIGLNTFIL